MTGAARMTGVARMTGDLGRPRRPFVLALSALLALLALSVVPQPARATAPQTRLEGVLVVGVAGLRWDDVGPDTPALARLAASGAVGALSVKAAPAVSCPADGWLTLGAGARAQAYGASRRPCDTSLVASPGDRSRNARSREQARLGALADALGGRVEAAGPGARLAVGAGRTGQPVVVVDGGAVGGPDRAAGAAAADRVVAEAVARRPPDVDLIVVGLSEGYGDDVAHLHVAVATGPGFRRGALTSASTRRSSYVQLVDVAPTVLSLLAAPQPAVMTGQPWRVAGPALGVAELVDLDRRAVAQKAATVPFYVGTLVGLFLVLTLLSPMVLRGREAHGARRAAALIGTALPAASFLAGLLPWWRVDPPLLGLLGVTVALAVALAALARRASSPVGAVCALTSLVLLGDLVTGAHLQLTSVTGYSPLVAGRFAGIGNVAFGVYAAAGLVATAWLARGRLGPVVALGAVLVVVDGAPTWGSDVGGVLALLPALVVLGLLVTGRRVSVVRLAAAGLAAVALVTALALADAARPADRRTHLGRFVGQVRDGTAGALLRRKAEAVLGLLFHSPVTALLPLVVAGAIWLLLRPPPALARAFAAAPAYRQALVAVGVASALGFALNDSGAAVPALALVVVLPATVAVVSGAESWGAGR